MLTLSLLTHHYRITRVYLNKFSFKIKNGIWQLTSYKQNLLTTTLISLILDSALFGIRLFCEMSYYFHFKNFKLSVIVLLEIVIHQTVSPQFVINKRVGLKLYLDDTMNVEFSYSYKIFYLSMLTDKGFTNGLSLLLN